MTLRLWKATITTELYVLAGSEGRAEELAAIYASVELAGPHGAATVEVAEAAGEVAGRWRGRAPYGRCGPAEGGPTCGEIAGAKAEEPTGGAE